MYLDTRSLSNSDGTIFKFRGQLGDNLPLTDAHRVHVGKKYYMTCQMCGYAPPPIDEKSGGATGLPVPSPLSHGCCLKFLTLNLSCIKT